LKAKYVMMYIYTDLVNVMRICGPVLEAPYFCFLFVIKLKFLFKKIFAQLLFIKKKTKKKALYYLRTITSIPKKIFYFYKKRAEILGTGDEPW